MRRRAEETTAPHGGERGYTVQVLNRAFRILELLSEHPARVPEISALLGLHRSTVFRLLSNLEQWSYVHRDEATGTYALGTRLFHLGAKALGEEVPVPRLRPVLAQLADQTGQTSQLWIRIDMESFCVDQVEPEEQDIRV